jgi:signal transduction histidine kinase
MANAPTWTGIGTIMSRRWISAAGIAAFACLIIATFIGLMALDLYRMRADALRTAERNTAAFALTLADNLHQTTNSVDKVMQTFLPRLEGDADRSFPAMDKVRSEMMTLLTTIPEAQIFAAFDGNGVRFLNLTGWPKSKSSAGATKDYFVAHRDNPNLGLTVSNVFQSGSGYTIMSLSRRLNNPDGSFAGTLAISTELKYLQRVYDQAALNRNGSISLYRADGTLLIRHPEAKGQINRNFSDTSLFTEHLSQSPFGTFSTVSTIDNTHRVVSYRKVEGVPLVVTASETFDDVLAPWHELVERYIILAGLIAIAVSGFAYALYRQMNNRIAADGRFRAALDSASNAFITLSPRLRSDGTFDLIIMDANLAASGLIGIDRQALIGTSLAAVAPTFHDNGIVDICVETYEMGRPSTRQVTYTTSQSDRRWVRVRTTPFRDGVALSLRDSTDEHLAQTALEEAKDNAENANRAKSDFLANMSHELRTPLNAVIGFADIIQQQLFGPVGSERYREYATLIRMSGAHLLEIISDILDLAKVEAHRVVLDEREIEIQSLMRICTTLVAGRAEEARVKVLVQTPTDMPHLIADELRIKQIVLNLLSNAVKFSPAGGEVHLGAALTDAGELAISVTDTGCGMTAEEIAIALQPFGQVSSITAKSKEGTGLGLPLARRMTEIHGGRLDIASIPGKGTIVSAILPASRVVSPTFARAV